MGSTSDKVAGYANEAAGNVKQGVGKSIGSDKLQIEGKLQELSGKGQQAMGKAKNAVNLWMIGAVVIGIGLLGYFVFYT